MKRLEDRGGGDPQLEGLAKWRKNDKRPEGAKVCAHSKSLGAGAVGSVISLATSIVPKSVFI